MSSELGQEAQRSTGLPVAVVPAISVIVLWVSADGGYGSAAWYLGGVVVLISLAAAVALGAPVRLPRWAVVAIAAFAGYVGWSYLSIAWARSPATALEGSNRALLYLACFVLFAIIPWETRTAVAALFVLVLGVGAVGFVTVVRLLLAHSPEHLLQSTSLATPIAYHPANAALWGMVAPVALVGASRVELPPPLRALLFATAVLLGHLAVLSQSRGWLIGFAAVLLVSLVLFDQRLRLIAWVVATAVATLVILPQLSAVYGAKDSAAIARTVHRAAFSSLAECAVLLAVGWALASVDQRRRANASRAPAVLWALPLVLVLAAGGLILGAHASEVSPTHLSDQSIGRGDLWRVSLHLISERPLLGLGQDNFGTNYLAERRTYQDRKWTHSLELRLLVHTGAVGLALFGIFLVAALRVSLARRTKDRWRDRWHRTVAALAVLPLLAWLIQGSVDWLWEFPALTGLAMAGLGIAVGLSSRGEDDNPPLLRLSARRALVGAGLLLPLAAMAPGLVAARQLSSAIGTWHRNPSRALAMLAKAGKDDVLSARPAVAAGLVAVNVGNLPLAQQRFEAAVRREPSDWFSHFALALVDTATGEPTAARAALETARTLNPREQVIGMAIDRLGTARPFTFQSGKEELRTMLLESTHLGANLDYAARAALPLVDR